MDIKRLAIGTIVGGITMLVCGYVIFGIAIADFYAANSLSGTYREAPVVWALALGNFSLAALVTLAIESRSGLATIGGGFTTAAIIGFLVWAGADLIIYAVTNVWGLASTIVDPLLSALNFGITGAVIAAVLARVPKSSAIRPAE
jgi:hypothetical protein